MFNLNRNYFRNKEKNGLNDNTLNQTNAYYNTTNLSKKKNVIKPQQNSQNKANLIVLSQGNVRKNAAKISQSTKPLNGKKPQINQGRRLFSTSSQYISFLTTNNKKKNIGGVNHMAKIIKFINDPPSRNITQPNSLYLPNYTELNQQLSNKSGCSRGRNKINISNVSNVNNLQSIASIVPNKKNETNININVNNNSFISDKNAREKIHKLLINIQKDLSNQLQNNPTNSKSKKYNCFKHAFENIIKSLESPACPCLNNEFIFSI